MTTTQQPDGRQPPDPEPAPATALRAWAPPELTSYGSFREITQGKKGSTGESGNYSMKS